MQKLNAAWWKNNFLSISVTFSFQLLDPFMYSIKTRLCTLKMRTMHIKRITAFILRKFILSWRRKKRTYSDLKTKELGMVGILELDALRVDKSEKEDFFLIWMFLFCYDNIGYSRSFNPFKRCLIYKERFFKHYAWFLVLRISLHDVFKLIYYWFVHSHQSRIDLVTKYRSKANRILVQFFCV